MTVRCVSERPRSSPRAWTEDEHNAFLKGIEECGRGRWSQVAKLFIVSRSPAQVASHAQKHFLRLAKQTHGLNALSAPPTPCVSKEACGDEKPTCSGRSADTSSLRCLTDSIKSSGEGDGEAVSREMAEAEAGSPSSAPPPPPPLQQPQLRPLVHFIAADFAALLGRALASYGGQTMDAEAAQAAQSLLAVSRAVGTHARRSPQRAARRSSAH